MEVVKEKDLFLVCEKIKGNIFTLNHKPNFSIIVSNWILIIVCSLFSNQILILTLYN